MLSKPRLCMLQQKKEKKKKLVKIREPGVTILVSAVITLWALGCENGLDSTGQKTVPRQLMLPVLKYKPGE